MRQPIERYRRQRLDRHRAVAALARLEGCGLVEMVGGNDPGTVRLALDAAYDSPHRFQPADMGFGECLAGTRIMLQMRIDIVAPLVRHSDLRDRHVDLSHPPWARPYAPDSVAPQCIMRLAIPALGLTGAAGDALLNKIIKATTAVSK